jgi:hypothetical protein
MLLQQQSGGVRLVNEGMTFFTMFGYAAQCKGMSDGR